jgi:hypothetical protein
MEFQRFLDPQFIAALNVLYRQNSWWTKLADCPKVFLAIRNNYLNAYSQGMSIGRIAWERGSISLRVHEEYLTTTTDNPYRNLLDENSSCFRPRPIVASIQEYVRALPWIMNRAGRFAGEERRGTNQFACNIQTVLDMEAAFDTSSEKDEPDPERDMELEVGSGRMDLVVLGPSLQLTIFEAKVYSNGDLRAREEPRVCGQLRDYNAFLVNHRSDVLPAYCNVLTYYSQLLGAFFQRRVSNSKTSEFLANRNRLMVDTVPRLLVFDYDSLQEPGIHRDAERIVQRINIGGFTRRNIITVGCSRNVQEYHLQ